MLETPRSTELTPSLRRHQAVEIQDKKPVRKYAVLVRLVLQDLCTPVYCKEELPNCRRLVSVNIVVIFCDCSRITVMAHVSLALVVPMANCAAVQPSLSASRWSSLILASCLRPSSLFTRSFSHWYPFRMERKKTQKHYRETSYVRATTIVQRSALTRRSDLHRRSGALWYSVAVFPCD